jgi:hypothetical protein
MIPFRKLVVAIVKITTGTEDSAQHRLETWTYDAGANPWTKLNPTQGARSSGNRARQLIFAPDWEPRYWRNCPSKPREQQIWTLRLSDAGSAPHRRRRHLPNPTSLKMRSYPCFRPRTSN